MERLAIPDLDTHARCVAACRRCPRLVEWREEVARHKRASYSHEAYWGRPVPGFGDHRARLLVLGLAPAAHGGNRTGRVFTGDRSGDWLYRALHRSGFANQPSSTHPDDGLVLTDAYVAAAVRCAPPQNKPSPTERDRCLPFLVRELRLLDRCRTVVVLGAFALEAMISAATAGGQTIPKSKPKFGHLAEFDVGHHHVVCSFHPSQQNTFTGRLTEPMFDAVFTRARELIDV